MLCVKPQDLKKLLIKNETEFNNNHLVLSIAAGTQLCEIEKVSYKII
jgi:pyrroline-5-carboxylate reductase